MHMRRRSTTAAVQLKPYLLRRLNTDIKYAEMVMGTGITESVYWLNRTPSRWAQGRLNISLENICKQVQKMVVFRVLTFGRKVLAADSGWRLGSGGWWSDWKEKIFRLCRKFLGPFSNQSYVEEEGIGLHEAFHFGILPNKTHSPWIWRQYFLPKRRNEFKVVHCVKTQSWTSFE